jgi:hypothetical protein
MTPWQASKKGTEHGHQVAIFVWANMAKWRGFEAAWSPEAYTARLPMPTAMAVPALNLLVAIPNGSQRDSVTGALLKAEGVKAGYPDIALNVPCGRYAGLFIELKVGNNVASDKQIAWSERLNAFNNKSVIVWGWEDACRTIEAYVKCEL